MHAMHGSRRPHMLPGLGWQAIQLRLPALVGWVRARAGICWSRAQSSRAARSAPAAQAGCAAEGPQHCEGHIGRSRKVQAVWLGAMPSTWNKGTDASHKLHGSALRTAVVWQFDMNQAMHTLGGGQHTCLVGTSLAPAHATSAPGSPPCIGAQAGLWQTRDQAHCSDKGCLLPAAAPCHTDRCPRAPGWSGSACQPPFPMLAACLQPRRRPGHQGLHVCEVTALRCVLLQRLDWAGACLPHHQH